jgi:hypothetical protein
MLAPTLAALALTLAAPAGRADIPPDPNSADAHCTPNEQCPNGVYCPYAFRPGKQPDPDVEPVGQSCRHDAGRKGLVHRCRMGGNYSGKELFCPKGETGTWSPEKPKTKRGCSMAAGSSELEGVALIALAALALLGARRWSARRGSGALQ